MKFNDKIVGKRVCLKALRANFETAEMVFKVVDESREFLLPWLPFASLERTKTKEDTYDFLVESDMLRKKGKSIVYGIFVEHVFIGITSVVDIEPSHKRGEIGFWISKYHSGNGYVSEAVKMLETELFETLDFNRVIMRCDSDNQASENVMKRLNYNFEGKWRQHKFQPLRNKYVDYLFYSKLKNEYFKG